MSIKRTGWASTDKMEKAIRGERGGEEYVSVCRGGNKEYVFGEYEVEMVEWAGRNGCRVELWTPEGNGNWGNRPNFAKSGLYKHIACVAWRGDRFCHASVHAESDNSIAIRDVLKSSDQDALMRQCLIQGLDSGDASGRTSAFPSLCREKLGA